ncbi:hypothetical protein KJD42_003551 [Escherichia coli]|uniref:hypothetical protein n=1 Tax=Escherichia coli TaxID=562 RepID=UPI0010AAC274|nr:hypothetical protein [Escherichia coli]EGD7472161.1 hypothetical protein [Escherichia coli]EHN5860651.1 hypothetical protein [Escherichia coli]EHR8680793.1 hypothetical protein [Escherichia coli]EIM2933174.1 hypothetical protein [Escherichia coli]EJA8552691.1 hypothetical protein [Escherichia coli]
MNTKLLAYLNNELHGVWVDSENRNIHIILKSSLPIIKSVWSGAPIHFLVGLSTKNILVIGMLIEDNVDNPFLLAYPPREADEIKGLDLLLSGAYDGILLSFFDSHTMRVMDLKIKVSENLPCECLKKFCANSYYLNSGFREGNEAMDEFCNNALTGNEKIISLPLSVIDKKSYLASVHEPNDTVLTYEFSVSENGSEGYEQEALIYHALRQVFSTEEVFFSPDVIEGNKKRELVDILIVENDYVLSIQSKASSLIEMGLKSHEKLCSMYKKKALQGIDQVKGVIPILNNDVVINYDGRECLIKRRKGIYHLVIISDLVLEKEGAEKIYNEISNLKESKGAKVLVMSLEGLVNFIRLSRLNKRMFWAMLEAKYKFSIKNRTILIRDIDSSQENNLPLLATDQYLSLLRGTGKLK